MRKVIMLLFSLVLAAGLTGCFEDEYPKIIVKKNVARFDDKRITVNGYMVNDENPYNRIETEDGIDIVIHFKEAPDE